MTLTTFSNAAPTTARASSSPGTSSALKYFVFGSVCEAVMVFGLSYWFGATGTTELAGLARLDARLPAVGGLVALLVGLGYKAALVPLHFWAPDAYDRAPSR